MNLECSCRPYRSGHLVIMSKEFGIYGLSLASYSVATDHSIIIGLPFRFPVPFQHLQHNLKLKPGRVSLSLLTHFDHLSPSEAILPDWSLPTEHIRWCNFPPAHTAQHVDEKAALLRSLSLSLAIDVSPVSRFVANSRWSDKTATSRPRLVVSYHRAITVILQHATGEKRARKIENPMRLDRSSNQPGAARYSLPQNGHSVVRGDGCLVCSPRVAASGSNEPWRPSSSFPRLALCP